MSIKTSFSIKDLENLSGVKAHTIRIWEKRYNLLQPKRSDTNIRTYDIDNLQKLLNIALLNSQGIKVSKISELEEDEIYKKVRELSIGTENVAHTYNAFKISMLNFDTSLFHNTFNQLLSQYSFREIFIKIIIPFLHQIGLLWITKTISPAHEHFISNLIHQKLLIQIERIQHLPNNKKKTFVLFLPLNEIHELGLLYIHYELLLKGYHSIYLGSSIPIEDLEELQKIFDDITFVSYFTVMPTVEKSKEYLTKITDIILNPKNEQLHILGRNTKQISPSSISPNIVLHKNIESFINL